MTQPIDEAELRLPPRTVEIYSLFKKKDTAVLTDKDYAKLLKWVEVYTTQAVTAALKRTDAALPEKGNITSPTATQS